VGGGVKPILTHILSTTLVMLTLLAIVAMLPFGIVIALLNQEKNHDAG
jgi:hypothetical protein